MAESKIIRTNIIELLNTAKKIKVELPGNKGYVNVTILNANGGGVTITFTTNNTINFKQITDE